jgi:DNA-directed RNA polymerase specialized sigma24 family protein
VRASGDEPLLVEAAAAGDPAAVAALWDAYGPGAYAFCKRVLGSADAAADAAQDAFLLAHSELGRLGRTGESFRVALLEAARRTSFELLARGAGAQGTHPRAEGLAGAAGRLRPQQRAALALAGLEALRYAELAAVLGVGVEAVPALLARARLRLHDELHGTALAATAARSPDCEDVVPLLAAAADGELGPADAAWADPHVTRCPTCARSRRALAEAAATYAAWSPAAQPSWLRGATLAEVGAEAPVSAAVPVVAGSPPPRRARRRGVGARVTPRPNLSVALLGATLLTAAFAALLLAGVGALRQHDALSGLALPGSGDRVPRSVQVAAAPTAGAPRRAARRSARHARQRRSPARPERVSFVAVRAVKPVATRSTARPLRRPAPARPRRPAARPKRTSTPRPAATPAAPASTGAPAPVSADAPADEPPGADGLAATVAATAPASPAPASPAPASTVPISATKPAAPSPAPTPSQSLPAGKDWHRGDRDRDSRHRHCAPHGRHGR